MRLRFWQKVPPPSSECTHLWGNWGEPTPITVTVMTISFGGAGTGDHERLSQTRKCLHCNRYERIIV